MTERRQPVMNQSKDSLGIQELGWHTFGGNA